MAVLGHDEFRLQRHHPVVIGRHERRRHHRMEVLDLVLAALAGRAVLAMNLARHVIFGAVQGDQHMIAKLAKILQAARSLQFRHTSAKTGWKWSGLTGAPGYDCRWGFCPDRTASGNSSGSVPPPDDAGAPGTTGLQEEQGKRRQADISHR